MIIKEFYLQREDGVNLFKTYSDNNFKIQKVNTQEIYDEAIDIEDAVFEYIETTELIEVEDIDEVVEETSASESQTEIENGDQELTEEEIATMLKEVF